MKGRPSPSAWLAILLCLAGGARGQFAGHRPRERPRDARRARLAQAGPVVLPADRTLPRFSQASGAGQFRRPRAVSAGSFSEGDGLFPGTYAVRMESWRSSARPGQFPAGQKLPARLLHDASVDFEGRAGEQADRGRVQRVNEGPLVGASVRMGRAVGGRRGAVQRSILCEHAGRQTVDG